MGINLVNGIPSGWVQYISLSRGTMAVAGAAHDGQSSVSSDAVGFIVAVAPSGGSIPLFKAKSCLPLDDILDEDIVYSPMKNHHPLDIYKQRTDFFDKDSVVEEGINLFELPIINQVFPKNCSETAPPVCC